MTDSDIITQQIIDLIIGKSVKQISDNNLINTCLSKQVLNQKKKITNELIKQTGIKSQQQKNHTQILNEYQPKSIKKQQSMYHSLRIVHNKKYKLKIPLIKNYNLSYCKNKFQATYRSNHFKSTKYTFKTNSEQSKKIQEVNQIQQMEIVNHVNSTQKLRDKLILENKQLQLQNIEQCKHDKLLNQSALEHKKKFQRQILAGKNLHTYNNSGKYLIFSQNNQKKALQKIFPISLSPQISQQQISLTTKQNQNSKSLKKAQLKKKIISYEHYHQNQIKQSQLIQDLFNNNNKRQISSVQFVKLKQGTYFQQPSSDKIITPRHRFSSTYSSFKPKSTFSKFFDTKQHSSTQIEKSLPISKTKRQQSLIGQLQISKQSLMTTIREKSKKFNGKINHMNYNLLKKLIFSL